MNDAKLLLSIEAKKKSGLIAALLNLFIPGLGYVYCGRWLLGIIAFFFVVCLAILSFGMAAMGLVLMLIIDGFLCANRYNRKLITDVINTSSNKNLNIKNSDIETNKIKSRIEDFISIYIENESTLKTDSYLQKIYSRASEQDSELRVIDLDDGISYAISILKNKK